MNKLEKGFGWGTSLLSKENTPTSLSQERAPTLNEDRIQALQDLQDFLSQYVTVDSTKVIDIGDAKKEGTTEKFNNNKSIDTAKTNITSFTNIPQGQKDKVLSYLNNPTKENIQSLQNFILSQSKWLPGFDRIAFYQGSFNSKFKWDESAFNGNKDPDGKFGKKTLAWFNSFMTTYDNYFKSTKESGDRGSKVAIANDIKNGQNDMKKAQQESATDKKSTETLDKAQLAWVLDSKEASALNDMTLKIDGDAVVYRGEKIPFADLGISKFAKNTSASTGWLAQQEDQDITAQNVLTPIDANVVLGYLNGDIKAVDGSIWVNGKNSADIKTSLDAKKKEIDVRATEKLKNSVVYNDKRNTYQYKGKEISRDNVGDGKGKLNLQQFQNEVDKANIKNNNQDRTVTTQTSVDGKTSRTVKDFEGSNGQKIVVTKENADGSLTKTVDTQRGDRTKLVTTDKDSGGNIINTTKFKETKNDFKEKADNKSVSLKQVADKGNEFVTASTTDVISALQKSDTFNASYNISRDLTWRVNVSIKEGATKQDQETFLKNFSAALKWAWISNLDMKDYKFKGEISKDASKNKLVNKLVFDVGPDTKKEQPLPTKEEIKETPKINTDNINNAISSAVSAAGKWVEAGSAKVNTDKINKVAASAVKAAEQWAGSGVGKLNVAAGNEQPATINLTQNTMADNKVNLTSGETPTETLIPNKVNYANSTLKVPTDTNTQENTTNQEPAKVNEDKNTSTAQTPKTEVKSSIERGI